MRVRGGGTRAFAAAVAVLAILLLAAACSDGHSAHAGNSTPVALVRCTGATASAAAPSGLPDLTLHCLGDGPAVDVAGIAGPAVVNLWASWCYPCRQEMPLLQDQSAAGGGTVHIVGVDTNDVTSHAIAFAKNTVHASYEELSDPNGELAIALHAPGLPYTVAIGRSGAVVWRDAGKLTRTDLAKGVHAAQAGG